MPVVTRRTDDPQELEGSEFTRVRFEVPDISAGSWWDDLRRVRSARTAYKIALELAELVATHPPG